MKKTIKTKNTEEFDACDSCETGLTNHYGVSDSSRLYPEALFEMDDGRMYCKRCVYLLVEKTKSFKFPETKDDLPLCSWCNKHRVEKHIDHRCKICSSQVDNKLTPVGATLWKNKNGNFIPKPST